MKGAALLIVAILYALVPTATAQAAPPLPPMSAVAEFTSAGAELTWVPPIEASQVASYVVYRDGTPIASVSGTSFVDSGGSMLNVYAIASLDNLGQESVLTTPATPMLHEECVKLQLDEFPFIFLNIPECLWVTGQANSVMVGVNTSMPVAEILFLQ